MAEGLVRWRTCAEQTLFPDESCSELAGKGESTLTTWMHRWLTHAGFGQLQQHAGMVDISSGVPLHALFEVHLSRTLPRLASWLRQRDLLGDLLTTGAWEQCVFRAWQEVRAKRFAASLPIVTIVSSQYPQTD